MSSHTSQQRVHPKNQEPNSNHSQDKHDSCRQHPAEFLHLAISQTVAVALPFGRVSRRMLVRTILP